MHFASLSFLSLLCFVRFSLQEQPLPQCNILFVLDFTWYGMNFVDYQKYFVDEAFKLTLKLERDENNIDIRANVWSIGAGIANGSVPRDFLDEGAFTSAVNGLDPKKFDYETVQTAIQELTAADLQGDVVYAIFTNSPQEAINRMPTDNAIRYQTVAFGIEGQELSRIALYSVFFDDDDIKDYSKLLLEMCKDPQKPTTPPPTTVTTTVLPSTTTWSPPACGVYFVLDGSKLGANVVDLQKNVTAAIVQILYTYHNDILGNGWLFGDTLAGDLPAALMNYSLFDDMLAAMASASPDDSQLDRAVSSLNNLLLDGQARTILYVIFSNSDQAHIDAAASSFHAQNATVAIGLNGQNLSNVAAYSFNISSLDPLAVASRILKMCLN